MPLIDPVTMASSSSYSWSKGGVRSTPSRGKKAATATAPPSTMPPLSSSSAPSLASAAAPTLLQPVRPKQTSVARATRYSSPALMSLLFIYNFSALVADPVQTMQAMLAPVAALQVLYALVCLPPAGSSAAAAAGEVGGGGIGGGASGSGLERKHRPGEKKKPGAHAEGAGPNAVVAAILSLALTVLLTPFLHGVTVLFGAPLLTHVGHTLLCAAHVALLSLFPLFYARGVDSAAWAAVAGFTAPLDDTSGGLIGAVVGAWLGAVPIPLDWDRDWQAWPVTILCGAYAGHVLGRMLGGTLAFGRRF